METTVAQILVQRSNNQRQVIDQQYRSVFNTVSYIYLNCFAWSGYVIILLVVLFLLGVVVLNSTSAILMIVSYCILYS